MDSTAFAPRPLAELRTLGAVDLQVGGEPRLTRRRKALALLAFLARHAPARLPRATLAPIFWPTSPEERARQSLRQALAELRQAAGDAVQSTAEHAWIDPRALAVDLTEFERAMDAGHLHEARERDGGTFLEGFEGVGGAPFDLWLASERERLEARRAWIATHGEARGPRDEDIPPPPAPPSMNGRVRRQSVPLGPLRSNVPVARSMAQDEALHALRAAWTRACQGGAEAVLLEGDAGLGKSHVLEQLARMARAEQPQSVTLVARALEGERRAPGSLVRQLLAAAPANAAAFDARIGDAALLRAASTRIAGVVPLLVVVDDATLADDDGQEALGALVESPPAGTLVVLAARPFMLSDVRFRAALQRNTALGRIALQPLDRDATERMLRTLLPLEDRLAGSLSARLWEERRGVAALVEATIAALVDDGYLAVDEQGAGRLARALPERLPVTADPRERARRLVPRLPAAAREVIEHAAVSGDAVELGLLGAMLALDAADVDAALAELSARRLLRPSVRGEGWVEFHSSAVRHAVLGLLEVPRRRALERTHERALRQRYGSRGRQRVAYAPATAPEPSALRLLRSTFAAAAGLLG